MTAAPVCSRAGNPWRSPRGGAALSILENFCFYNKRMDAVDEIVMGGTTHGPVGFQPEVLL
jgi:hypothetical protein